MATAFKEVARINKPVTLQAAFYALSVMQDTVKESFPEARGVTVTLEASGAMRLTITTPSLADPSEIVFSLKRHLVPGYRFAHVTQNRETTGGHVVTALVEIA